MNKIAREVTKADLIPLEEYAKNRKTIRKEIVAYKKNRRISLGPYANFYFESYETMKAQIQEMLYYRIVERSVSGFATGLSPIMAVEIGRRSLDKQIQPTADDLEEKCKEAAKGA